MTEEREEIYNDIWEHFLALRDGIVQEVDITFCEMAILDYVLPHYMVVTDRYGNARGYGINGFWNNYADVLREFAKKNDFVQVKDDIGQKYCFYRR